MIKPPEPPESFLVQSAYGWLELGNAKEAEVELSQLPPVLEKHPEVLECRWQLAANAEAWDSCVALAGEIISQLPDEPGGWIHRSFALHELQRTTEARDNLLSVVKRFPNEATLRYNLACYECRLGNLDTARTWLDQAMKLGDKKEIQAMALLDPDLETMRDELKRG